MRGAEGAGAPRQTPTFFSSRLVQNNDPLASAMSFVLMFIIIVLVIIYSRFFGTEDLA